MDFKERFKDRTAFFKRDGSVNQQGENITLLAGSANPNSRLAQERAENDRITKQIINQQLGLAPEKEHYKITFQPNQSKHPTSSEFTKTNQIRTQNQENNNPYLESNPYLECNPYSIPSYTRKQSAQEEGPANLGKQPARSNSQKRVNTTQKAKENLLPPKSGTANPTPQDYSKLRNPPMSSQYRHNSADESRPIMNSKHIPKPMTVQNHEERRDQLRNVVSEGKQSRPPLPNQNNKFAEFPAAKQHVTIEEDGYAYNNRYGKPAPNDHYQPEFQYNYQNKDPRPNYDPDFQNDEVNWGSGKKPRSSISTLEDRPKEEYTSNDYVKMYQKKQMNFGSPPTNEGSTLEKMLPKPKTGGDSTKAYVSDGGYKQYTLKEFKELNQTTANQKRGGLGPNIGSEEWQKRKEKLEKMQKFAANVNTYNVTKISVSNPEPKQKKSKVDEEREKARLARERALEFAKNVPKPKPKVSDDSDSDEEDSKPNYYERAANGDNIGSTAQNNVLSELEMQHQRYLDEIKRMKSG